MDDKIFSNLRYGETNDFQVSWSRGYYKKLKSTWWRIMVFNGAGQVFRVEISPTEECAERRVKELERELESGRDLYLYNERVMYAHEMPKFVPIDETLHKRKKKSK